MPSSVKQVFFNIGELKTATGTTPVGGKAQSDLLTLHNAWILIEDGIVSALGEGWAPKADKKVDRPRA